MEPSLLDVQPNGTLMEKAPEAEPAHVKKLQKK
jgi:hypothetical protein